MTLDRSRTRLSRARKSAGCMVVAVLLGGLLVPPASAAVTAPTLELIAPGTEVDLYRYGRGEPVYLELGLLVSATEAPFELLAQRPDYTQPPTLSQVLHGSGGQTESRALDPALLDEWRGLKDFFELSFRNSAGTEVVSKKMVFCPSGFMRERVDDSGPTVPTYPAGCYANPFTRGVVWGIDESWAVSASGYDTPPIAIPNGNYTLTVNIAPTYVELFGIDPADATVQMKVTVQRVEDECFEGCRGYEQAQQQPEPGGGGASDVPFVDQPDPSVLPDLIALPSWGINVENRSVKSFLSFGATVWNGGSAPLVVEGFRESGESLMDAFQYFYDGDDVVGKAAAGALQFDPRRSHQHWHFKQFAGYSLLNAESAQVVRSRKEAFCLAPTDAMDLTIPDADWNPGALGLYTACGSPTSMWIREILPLGWGDTYFQGLPGQSFNITNVPNGTYYIRVEANVGGLLHEQRTDNNVELRQVILKGRAGQRRVVVPPWNGIDTEAGFRTNVMH